MIFWSSFHLFYSSEIYLEYMSLINIFIWKWITADVWDRYVGWLWLKNGLQSFFIVFFLPRVQKWWQFVSLEFSLDKEVI